MNTTHTVSLELSKKLKEIGYKQEGEFWWEGNKVRYVKKPLKGHYYIRNKETAVVAPLASELMERLPILTVVWKMSNSQFRICRKDNENFYEDTNLCNALAKMYIYLAEKGLLKEN